MSKKEKDDERPDEEIDGEVVANPAPVALAPAKPDAHTIAIRGDIDGLLARYETIKRAAVEVLHDDVDFGTIPGTSKPTLLKPGAEKLCALFHLHPRFRQIEAVEDWEGGFFFYRYRCELFASDGTFVGEGVGSCNSREPRYRYRTQKRTCPACGEAAIMRSKYPPRDDPEGEPGWYCNPKGGGCGTAFAFVDTRITEQEQERVENPEPFELVNTIDKMSQKRALIAAALVTTGASEFFTQDIEDMDSVGGGANREASAMPMRKAEKAARAPKAVNGKAQRPLEPEQLRDFLARKANGKSGPSSEAQQKLLAQKIEECFAGEGSETDNRRVVTTWLCGAASTKDVSKGWASGMLDWLLVGGDGGDKYDLHPAASAEAHAVLRQAIQEAGQAELPLEAP